MANVAETRVRITLTDAMSGPLKNIHGNLINTNAAAAGLEKTFSSMASAGAGIAAGMMGVYSLTDAFGGVLGKAIDFSKSLETETIGMAGILTSMTKLDDKTLDWNTALGMSRGIMKELNTEALKTAATSDELITTFRALLGPGLGAGMNIDHIKQFTVVGVNAVKSMGLEGRQLVQELRDLVQGGIQPASSTLATALGLKDADIKAAKNSAEGLYNFLMKRLAGFKQAAEATPSTLQGMQSQLQEGLTLSLTTGLEPILNEYKQVLQSALDVVIDPDSFQINKDFVSDLQSASDHIVNIWQGLENVADYIEPVIVPAVRKLGEGLALAADNTDKIIVAFTAYKGVSIINDVWQLKNAADGAYQAQPLLGQAVQNTTGYWNRFQTAGTQAYNAEMLAAQNAAVSVIQAEGQKQQAIKQTETVQKGVSRLSQQGNEQLAARLNVLKERYQLMGASAEQAGKMQYQAAKQAVKGQAELTVKIIESQEAHILAAKAATQHADTLQKWQGRIAGAGAAVGALSSAVLMLSDDTDSFAYSLANTGLAISSGITAIGLFIEQLGNLAKAYREVAEAGAAAGLLKFAGFMGGGTLAIGAGVGLAAAGVYAKVNDLSLDDMIKRWTYSKEDYDKETDKENSEKIDHYLKVFRQQDQYKAVMEAAEKSKRLTQAFPKEIAAPKAKGPSSAERYAEKIQKEREKNERIMNDLSAELDRKILEDTGSTFEIQMSKLDEEIQKMQSKVERAAKAGVDTSGVTTKLIEYRNEEEKRLEREKYIDLNQQRMDYIQAQEEAGNISAQKADELRIQQLESHKEYLAELLNDETLTMEQRLELQKQYAQATTELQSAKSTEWQESWDTALEHLKNTQFDQLSTLKNGWDDITGSIANFGQNMLTEQKSFSERCKDLYNDLANSIMNTMMKVIMQGLVMKSIMGIFGMGGGGGTVFTSDVGWDPGYIAPSNDINMGYVSGYYAKGGIADGWSIVGEEGPELVNFTSPGRVYTAA